MAKNSGRRSSDDLAAEQFYTEISPTRKLLAAEQAVWDRIIAAWPKNHFIKSDSEILTQYCAACLAFEKSRQREDLKAMECSGRLCLSYATKLRITPQSRYDHKGTHTEAARGRENDAADDRLLGGIESWQHEENEKPN